MYSYAWQRGFVHFFTALFLYLLASLSNSVLFNREQTKTRMAGSQSLELYIQSLPFVYSYTCACGFRVHDACQVVICLRYDSVDFSSKKYKEILYSISSEKTLLTFVQNIKIISLHCNTEEYLVSGYSGRKLLQSYFFKQSPITRMQTILIVCLVLFIQWTVGMHFIRSIWRCQVQGISLHCQNYAQATFLKYVCSLSTSLSKMPS